MLRSLQDLRSYSIHAVDGDLGKVYDFYFDDTEWKIRYFVIDTGHWFPGRKVLISPQSVQETDVEAHSISVSLTREQIQNSPLIDTAKVISRQEEEKLAGYFGWPFYWGYLPGEGPYSPTSGVINLPRTFETQEEGGNVATERSDFHLQSANEMFGYHVHAIDGEIGKLKDFIVHAKLWTIRYLVIDTGKWFVGKKVLVAPDWIHNLDWKESRLNIDLMRETVQNSPPYDPSEPINRDYEHVLYDYYGRKKYWLWI
jgi:sporulation protein YlmC with PRC-barrel domain